MADYYVLIKERIQSGNPRISSQRSKKSPFSKILRKRYCVETSVQKGLTGL